MTGIFNNVVRMYLRKRYKRVVDMMNNSPEIQDDVFKDLIQRAKNTQYGKTHSYASIDSRTAYCKNVPIVNYDELKPLIQKSMQGEESVLWPGKTLWYSKSSGTTDRSKYLPVSDDSYQNNHIAAGWDTMASIYHNDPACEIFKKKNLVMGGSLHPWDKNEDVTVGDVSAILLKRLPMVARPFYTPDFETALLDDWEEKLERMATICMKEDVTMFGGVPTWTIVLFNKILEMTGQSTMEEVWPSARYYLHGGVGFDPYREQFKEYFPTVDFRYYEVYNASEGYFASSNHYDQDGMLLLTNNDIYYEFLEMSDAENTYAESVPLADVEIGKNYVVVISTSAGLWRYKPGDTVQFLSKNPYKIKVSGRTKHHINVFGEEVMVGNTDAALAATIKEMHAVVAEYTVGPIFLDASKGGHNWVIEFEEAPEDVQRFGQILDTNLQKINSDYAAKRHKDLALKCLRLDRVPTGSFHRWMREQGKMGGQHKVPRLSNTRQYVDQLLEISGQRN